MRSCLFVAATIFATPSFAGAHICWFDHVSADGDKMALHFSANASLRLWGQGRSYFIVNGSIHESGGGASDPGVEVALAPGQSLMGSTIPEDSCTYEATKREGKTGLLITASNNAFGHHTTSTEFLLPE